MSDPQPKRRKPRVDPRQDVFRFADEARIENETLRSENVALRAEVARLREQLMEAGVVIELYGAELQKMTRPSPSSPSHAL